MTDITRESIIQSMQDAAERMGLDLEDLQEMIAEVLEDCLGKSNTLKNAVSSGDSASIKAIAHDIKGSSANYGLQYASALALEIEKNCDNPPVDTADSLIAHFQTLSSFDLEKMD